MVTSKYNLLHAREKENSYRKVMYLGVTCVTQSPEPIENTGFFVWASRAPGKDLEMSDFGKTVQIIPCTTKTWAILADKGILHAVKRVYYLALTDSGEICGLINNDGCLEIADTYCNFYGIYEGEESDIVRKVHGFGLEDNYGLLGGFKLNPAATREDRKC